MHWGTVRLTSATLHDNIFTNVLPSPKSVILISDISDHFSVAASIPTSKSNSNIHNPNFTSTFNYTPESLNNLQQSFSSADWSSVYNTGDVNTAFINCNSIFSNVHQTNITTVNKKNSKLKPNYPWITISLLKSIKFPNKLYCKFIKNRSHNNHLIYTRYRNVLTSVLRNANKNYYLTKFNEEKKHIKNTWKIIINSVLNKNS